ncbi:hypothetical protein CRI94_12755 [Longibacter salinarum]|uniref:Uncharacterized protein n=2 Tax=Longibacter salinarum TaxID=1850348 RepID=A0A2A8CWL4_9BACT|nr:hypothetical protein CRI94_12755 [Longibacter salinarum]
MNTDSTTYRQRQILLFATGAVMLTDPFLSIFRTDEMIAGVPVLVVALFSIWALLIVGVAWLMERGGPDPLRTPPPTDDYTG